MTRPSRFAVACFVIGLSLFFSFACGSVQGLAAAEGNAPASEDEKQVDAPKRKAVIVQFRDAITPLSGALLKRRFAAAVESGAEVVVLEIDSPGGYVSTTLELVEMLENARGVQTVAYIPREAISGAAILSLAADKIIMGPQALMGDAGMITVGEDAAFRYVPEKERSYLVEKVRALATRKGRSPALAEAMIEKDLVVHRIEHKTDGTVRFVSDREWQAMAGADQWTKSETIAEAGNKKFLTVQGQRAVELGLADQVISEPEELAGAIGAAGPIDVIRGNWVDVILLILSNPFITALMLIVGLVALVIEFGSPGLGMGGLISIVCFGLFFWSRFLGGTSGWFEVILFIMGLCFVMLEIFVIPGIGVAGVFGVAMIVFSLVMASRRVLLPESSRDLNQLMVDVLTVLSSLVGFAIAMLFLGRFLGELPFLSRLALAPATDEPTMVPSLTGGGGMEQPEIAIGQIGTSQGPLRPAGRARFGEQLVDVTTEGDFVDTQVEVKVVSKSGNRIVVRTTTA